MKSKEAPKLRVVEPAPPEEPGAEAHAEVKAALLARVGRIQRKPFAWPGEPDAESARGSRTGTCASKHALLAEGLDDLGLSSAPLIVAGRLVPTFLEHDPEFEDAIELQEVHECLVVNTPWSGPLRVDVTWDPPLIAYGLPGTLDWDAQSDMRLAVDGAGAGWTVPRRQLRSAKEALRSRLYTKAERTLRDKTLAALSRRFAAWRI